MTSIKPIHIDALVLVLLTSFVAFFAYITTQPTSAALLGPTWYFWLKAVSAALSVGTGSLSIFRTASNSAVLSISSTGALGVVSPAASLAPAVVKPAATT